MSEHDELSTVSAFGPDDRAEDVYDRWAGSYDHDLVHNYGYNSPELVAGALAEMTEDASAAIVDHACGTGLSGVALRAAGFSTIDGVDVSAGMLEGAAAKGVYRHLVQADLTSADVTLPEAPYAAMTLVGALAPGHLEPEDLPALMQSVSLGAPVVVSFNAAYDVDNDYLGRVQTLERDGHWTVERRERTNYMDALERPGWLIAARRRR